MVYPKLATHQRTLPKSIFLNPTLPLPLPQHSSLTVTDSRSIFRLFIICGTIIFAAWLGISIITDQIETIIYLIVGATLLACALLGKKIWLLIPFMAALDLTLRLPSQPNSLLLAQILVLGFSTLLFLTRKLPFIFRISELEYLMLALIAIVAQAYIRNPVGISIFGSDTVGGKNYFLFAVTCLSSFLLCFLRVPTSQLAAILKLSIIGGIMNFMISIIGQFVPIVGLLTGTAYAMPTGDTVANQAPMDSGAANRIGFLANLSRNLALWISCMISPVMGLMRPLWLLLILVAVAGGALCGFRSGFMTVLTIFALGTLYRGGAGQVTFGLLGTFAVTAILAFTNAIHPFPPNVQRAMTFLPGTWEERYKLDAAGSTEWRTEIWKEALFTERWISNKLLGDGLGFTAVELQAQINAMDGRLSGISGFDSQRENILASGDYHSVAVSAVRTCGYVGLLVLLVVMFRLVVHAHRLIRRCRGTRWYTLSLFLGLPPMLALINLPIGASSFLQVASATLLSLSLIRLAENNIDLTTPAITESEELATS